MAAYGSKMTISLIDLIIFIRTDHRADHLLFSFWGIFFQTLDSVQKVALNRRELFYMTLWRNKAMKLRLNLYSTQSFWSYYFVYGLFSFKKFSWLLNHYDTF